MDQIARDRLDFDQAFRRLTAPLGKAEGFPPFPWQARLFERFCRDDPPAALDLPTGLGKTTTMALWLIARAVNPALPRRLVYVVDRRAVVDQSSAVAEDLARNLDADRDLSGVLGLEDPLALSTLRGGFADNRHWLADPAATAIVVGTVDMIGSRLLFEGYGVSRRMRPFHAGLLGADTLVLLDEAHLSWPFWRLLRQASGEGALRPAPMIPAMRVMALSATGASAGAGRDGGVFHLDEEDRADPEIARRLDAVKRLRLESAETWTAEAIAERAAGLVDPTRPMRVLIYLNSRLLAVAVRAVLAKRFGDDDAAPAIHLLTGARRGLERERATKAIEADGFLAGGTSPERSAFLISTAAGEVGIDLDADAMLCDLVPWERMVQRLGRVNRRGEGDAQVVVLDPGEAGLPKGADKAWAEQETARRRETRVLLGHLPHREDGTHQAGPGAIDAFKAEPGANERIARASTPPPLSPALTRPLLESWSLTGLAEHTGRPEVAPWLRGWEENAPPQTTLVWRRLLPVATTPAGEAVAEPATVAAYLELAPPQMVERLETETASVVDWLGKRAARLLKAWHRAEKANDAAARDALPAPGATVALVVDRALERREEFTLEQLAGSKDTKDRRVQRLAQATLVLDARLGGLADGLLDPKDDAVPPSADDAETWRVMDGTEDGVDPRLPFRVLPWREDGEDELVPDGWYPRRRFATRYGPNGEAVAGFTLHTGRAADTPDRSVAAAQLLSEHTAMVEAEAERLAQILALPAPLAEALRTAARWHDHGKAAPRWQNAMGGTPGAPLAKTARPRDLALLQGYRHELGSWLAAEANGLAGLDDTARELALHLIAAHHGHARPLIPVAGVDAAPPSALDAAAGRVARGFARLQHRYGPWGLAWLETLMRAADQRASRRHEAESEHG